MLKCQLVWKCVEVSALSVEVQCSSVEVLMCLHVWIWKSSVEVLKCCVRVKKPYLPPPTQARPQDKKSVGAQTDFISQLQRIQFTLLLYSVSVGVTLTG